jgi:hypothetical protein
MPKTEQRFVRLTRRSNIDPRVVTSTHMAKTEPRFVRLTHMSNTDPRSVRLNSGLELMKHAYLAHQASTDTAEDVYTAVVHYFSCKGRLLDLLNCRGVPPSPFPLKVQCCTRPRIEPAPNLFRCTSTDGPNFGKPCPTITTCTAM